MTSPTRRQRADSFVKTLADSRAVGDDDAEWGALWGLLELLHSLDEEAKDAFPDGKQAYYTDRASSSDGQALGALTWFRDAVHHMSVEPQQLQWRHVVRRTRQGDSWVVTKTRSMVEGVWRSADIQTAVTGWPARSSIPPSEYPARERDTWYEQLIETATLVGPIDMALAYLDRVLPR